MSHTPVPSVQLNSGAPCSRCGYDIRSLRDDDACPECGYPVARSRQGTFWQQGCGLASWWRTGLRVLFAPARLWVGRGEGRNSTMLLAVNSIVVHLGAASCLLLGATGNEMYDTFISSGGSMMRPAVWGAAKGGAIAGVAIIPCYAAGVCVQVFITLSVLHASIKARCKEAALAAAVLAHSSYPMAFAALCGTAVYAAAVLSTATRWTATPSTRIEMAIYLDKRIKDPVRLRNQYGVLVHHHDGQELGLIRRVFFK